MSRPSAPTELDRVIADINARGYGLTFGLHTRIDDRVQEVSEAIHAGNIYVNRNQIGAVVGSQPFGGEGLSGTGPRRAGRSIWPASPGGRRLTPAASSWPKYPGGAPAFAGAGAAPPLWPRPPA
jgi:RHH-type proline utilization regulon transcriptional repressor/proline dehydrogenase/delta 1-pyrroline-5-carboxylate dehydrogenase